MTVIDEAGCCLKCGSYEVRWCDCWSCGGKGGQDGDDLMEVDPLWYGPDDWSQCDICKDEGGFHVCQTCAGNLEVPE